MKKILKIDAHQHFWIFDSERDQWIADEMNVIRRDFLPEHLSQLLVENQISGSVAIQANQSETENEFLLSLSKKSDWIKGVVGWVDFSAEDAEDRLAYYSGFKIMKGFRHILQGESDRAFMLSPEFMRGINKLNKYGFTYDILIHPDQLRYTETFVKSLSDQLFVIDHIAKPDIKNGDIKGWRENLRRLGQYENVYCKISGLVTEADWQQWRYEDFDPFLDAVFETFGASRILYGSDWPVCEIAGGYARQMELTNHYLSKLSESEQAQVWGGNAVAFYNL